ncbi:MAG: hypothetical protein K5859_03450 [Atopobiaceae bacterium]|nr:hypothetical protein [Atopobiaceae bacterium]
MGYLDNTGLAYFWGKVKAYVLAHSGGGGDDRTIEYETIYEDSGITIERWGCVIMVQCHGVSATPNSNVALANVDMSDYKPSYNMSALVCDTQNTTHFARLWVSASDGKPYLAFAGYNGQSTWYGTLTYIVEVDGAYIPNGDLLGYQVSTQPLAGTARVGATEI